MNELLVKRFLSPDLTPGGAVDPPAPAEPVIPTAPEPQPASAPAPVPKPVVSANDDMEIDLHPRLPLKSEDEPKPAPTPAPVGAKPVAQTLEELEQELTQTKLKLLQFDPFAFEEPEGQAPTPVPSSAPASPAPKPSVEPTPAPKSAEPKEFVSEEEYDSIFENRENLNQLLSKVYNQAVTDTVDKAVQEAQRKLGSEVDSRTRAYTQAVKVIDDFFRENADLEPYAEQVQQVAVAIRQRRPGASTKEVLSEAGKQMRKIVRTQAPVPGFTPPVKGGYRSVPEPTGSQKEFKDTFPDTN